MFVTPATKQTPSGGLALGWGGWQAACLLPTVLAASVSLPGEGGLFGCPEVPRQWL